MKKAFVLFSLIPVCICNLYAQVEFTSSNLPIVIIDTYGQEISDEPKITAHMGIINNGEGVINNITDSFNDYDGMIGIETRGSSSQQFLKRQFAVETRSADEKDTSVSLLGMPKEADWILGAPYSDKTLIRELLAYHLSKDLERYASRAKLCEVVINGEYWGVYVLLEKVKQNNKRVDIKKMTKNDNEGDDLTGGYIVKVDKPEGSEVGGWYSDYKSYDDEPNKIYYQYHYPSEDDITTAQKNYIRGFIDHFEDVMNSDTYNDPFNGFYDIIDLDAFVDYYLVEELGKNVDGYRISTYVYKDRDSEDSKLKLGPIWDFSNSFGNCDYDEAYLTTGWEVTYRNYSDFLTPFWFRKLFSDPVFFNQFKKRWNEVKGTVLSLAEINSYIDEKVDYLANAADRNFQKWQVMGTYVWPNYFIGNTYSEEIEYLKNWISGRWNWLNSNLPSDFSTAQWTDNANTISVQLNQNNQLPGSSFYSSVSNIDEVRFFTNSANVDLNFDGSTLSVAPHTSEIFFVRAIGYKNSDAVVVSPLYKFNCGITGCPVDEQSPDKFSLHQNYPNPFNPVTVIGFQLPVVSKTQLKIYDVLGNEVATLINNEAKGPGVYNVEFNASNLPSGIYFYRLICGSYIETKKMEILK